MSQVSSDQSYQSILEKTTLEKRRDTESVLPQKPKEILEATQKVEEVEGVKTAVKGILPSQLQEFQKRVIRTEGVKEILQQTEQVEMSVKVFEVARESQIVPPRKEEEIIKDIKDYILQGNNEPFKMAVKNGDEEMVDRFMGILDSVCIDRDAYLNGALLIAAEEGHEKIVEKLLEIGMDKDKVDESFRTPLIIAAQKGHIEVIRLLIESACSEIRTSYGKMRSNDDVLTFIHKTDLSERSALMIAAESGHKEIVELLLAKTFYLVRDNKDKKEKWMNKEKWNQLASAYMLALAEGHKEVANIIKEVVHTEGLDFSEFIRELKPVLMGALMSVAKDGDVNVVKDLSTEIFKLAKDTQDEKEMREISRAFFSAVEGGDKEIVGIFIETAHIEGLDVSKMINTFKEDGGHTALMQALLFGHDDLAKILIENGADVKACTDTGYSVLVCAIIGAKDIDNIKKILLEKIEDEQSRKFEDDYAENLIAKIFLAHVCGIGGVVKIQRNEKSYTLNLEGAKNPMMIRMLSSYINIFFKSENEIPKVVKDNIQDAINTAFPLFDSSENILIRIKQKKPAVILYDVNLGIIGGHAISMVIHNNKLFICNRAKGFEDMSTTVYALPDSKIDKTMIENLIKTHQNIQSFNQITEGLTRLPDEGTVFSQKFQKLGNCTWASAAKGSLLILCILLCENPEIGREVYKKFTSWIRENVLDDYLDRYASSDEDREKDELIKMIYEKGRSILKEEGENPDDVDFSKFI